MKRFFITGVSGVGKSTISRMLNEKGIPSIDLDQIEGLCHRRNKVTGEKAEWKPGTENDWYQEHGWVCETERLIQLMNEHKDMVVVVGYTSNQNEFIHLFDKVFILYCKPETFIDRLNTRESSIFGKHEAEQKRLLDWYKTYEEMLLSQGAIPINTEDEVDVIVNKIIDKIRS
jgi:dephospho-CoA kinase